MNRFSQLAIPLQFGESGRPLMYTISRNSARCGECGDEIESTHRHDFKSCTCGSLFVDGGKDYIRRGFQQGTPYEDTSTVEYEEATNEQIAQYRAWDFF